MKLKTILDIDIDFLKTVDDTILECFEQPNQIIKCEDCDQVHHHTNHLEKNLCGDCSGNINLTKFHKKN